MRMADQQKKSRQIRELKKKKGEVLFALKPRIEELFENVETFMDTLGYSRDAFYKWTRKGSWPHMAEEFERKVTEQLGLDQNPFAAVESELLGDWRQAQRKLQRLWFSSNQQRRDELLRYLDRLLQQENSDATRAANEN